MAQQRRSCYVPAQVHSSISSCSLSHVFSFEPDKVFALIYLWAPWHYAAPLPRPSNCRQCPSTPLGWNKRESLGLVPHVQHMMPSHAAIFGQQQHRVRGQVRSISTSRWRLPRASTSVLPFISCMDLFVVSTAGLLQGCPACLACCTGLAALACLVCCTGLAAPCPVGLVIIVGEGPPFPGFAGDVDCGQAEFVSVAAVVPRTARPVRPRLSMHLDRWSV